MAQTAKEAYEALLTTLSEENNKGYNEQNQEYYSDTLNLFNKAGEIVIEHEKWRRIHMLQDMVSILIDFHYELNIWKYKEPDIYNDPEQDLEPYNNDPEQDLERYINVEKFPYIMRKDLEMMAAQRYIKKTTGIYIPLPNPAEEIITDREENQTNDYLLKYKLETEGKEISFNELANILKKYRKLRNTVQKHCARITDDIRAGKKELPCAVFPGDPEIKYGVIKISDTLANKTKGMLFQKIVDSKEN